MKNFLKITLLLDTAIFSLAGIIYLLSNNLKFGTILIWVGLGGIVLGTYAAFGGWNVAPGEYNLKFDQKIPQLNYERTPEKWSEIHKSYSFCLYMGAASVIPIIVGLLLN